MEVAIGIDSHKGSLAAAAVDAVGRIVDVREFRNRPDGHGALIEWVSSQPGPRTIGVEGSRGLGAAVARRLLLAGEDVSEVPASLTHRQRRRRPSQGKSDPVDAVAIARVVAVGEGLSSARRAQVLADLKLLVDYRDQLVRTRTQVANRSTRTSRSSARATRRRCRTCGLASTSSPPEPCWGGTGRCERVSFVAVWRRCSG